MFLKRPNLNCDASSWPPASAVDIIGSVGLSTSYFELIVNAHCGPCDNKTTLHVLGASACYLSAYIL